MPEYSREFFNNIKHLIDYHVCVSEWQRNYTIDYYELDEEYQKKMKVIGNMVRYSKCQRINRNPKKIIFCSHPTRGFEYSCYIINQVRKKISNIEFHCFFSKPVFTDKQFCLANQTECIIHDKLSNKDLLEEMANSAILLYPITHPHETFCNVVAEALTQGCIPITRDFTGISTTCEGAGVLLKYEGKKPKEIIDEYTEAVIKVLTNVKYQEALRIRGYNQAKKWSRETIIEEWKKII